MPVNYNNTVIYMIYKPDSDLNTYVGHTTNFKKRVTNHRTRYNGKDFPYCNLQLYDYMRENGQFDEWTFEIITEYPCNSKREAEKKEQHFIDLFKSELNSMKAYTSSEDANIRSKKYRKVYYDNHTEEILSKNKKYRDVHKDEIAITKKNYYENNKEEILSKHKKYYEIHKEEIAITQKKYNEIHKEEILSKMKIYRDTHKEEINKKKKERIKCEICGCFSVRSSIARHKKSVKCQSFIK